MVRAYVTVARIHASHPSSYKSRPPRPPSDTRNDRHNSRFRSESSSEGEHKSQADHESIDSTGASFITMRKRNDYSIQCTEEALSLQRNKLGNEHPSVTLTLHSLALEYKSRDRYDEAMYYLKGALKLLVVRMTPFYDIVRIGEEDVMDNASIDSCESSTCVSLVASLASSVSLDGAVALYEEMSVVYSCMGNIYTLKGMSNEAADCYTNSVNMLVEANYDGASTRLTMMLRILERAKFRRRQPKPHEGVIEGMAEVSDRI